MFFKKRKLPLIINNKGSTMLDVMIALMIIMFVVLIAGNSRIFVKKNLINIDKKSILMEVVLDEISTVYNTADWTTLSPKVISTKHSNITINYPTYINETANKTSLLVITFSYDSNVVDYTLERSIYYDE